MSFPAAVAEEKRSKEKLDIEKSQFKEKLGTFLEKRNKANKVNENNKETTPKKLSNEQEITRKQKCAKTKTARSAKRRTTRILQGVEEKI